jgi:hypothetical protein
MQKPQHTVQNAHPLPRLFIYPLHAPTTSPFQHYSTSPSINQVKKKLSQINNDAAQTRPMESVAEHV